MTLVKRDAWTFFRCPACGGTACEEGAEAAVCPACGSRYPILQGMPLLVPDWERHEARLQELRERNPGWFSEPQATLAESPWRHHLRKRRAYVESVLRRRLAAQGAERIGRLLDLGCGDGTNLAWLAPFAQALYGSDYNLVRVLRARQQAGEAILFLADILNYPVRDAFFDLVFFNHVIEHILEDRQALSTVFRILKPGGLLILGTPNEGAWWWQLAYRRAPQIRAGTDHVHFYTAHSIGDKLEALGFRLQEVMHLGWGPPDWGWDQRLRQYKLLDDLFELLGRALFPRQASSLYLVAEKPE
jgi:SAM-dependent methyltransferase